MTTPSATAPPGGNRQSPLDTPPARFAEMAFYTETLTLLRCVRDHDVDTLAALCDDESGIVDVDPSGNARPIRDRGEREAWFHELFATCRPSCAAEAS